MTSVLGLDIGGSAARARLVVDGSVAAEASAGSASLAAAGERLAEANLRSLLGAIAAAHSGTFDVVCAGAAGSGAAPARAWLERTLGDLTGAPRVSVVDDVELVLPAAGYAMGIAVVCGTGSIVHGRGPTGSARAGGWGWLLGDEGGGYALVRDGLRTLLARRDATNLRERSARRCSAQPAMTRSTRCSPPSTPTRVPSVGRRTLRRCSTAPIPRSPSWSRPARAWSPRVPRRSRAGWA